jgi:hypothetical protein
VAAAEKAVLKHLIHRLQPAIRGKLEASHEQIEPSILVRNDHRLL